MESNICSDEGSFRDYELRGLNPYGVTVKCVRPSKSRKRARRSLARSLMTVAA